MKVIGMMKNMMNKEFQSIEEFHDVPSQNNYQSIYDE
jgi:hypothetical protein